MLTPKPREIITHHLSLRPVQISDAAFLLATRQQAHKQQFLSAGSQSLYEQEQWLAQHAGASDELYLVASLRSAPTTPIGAVRLYQPKPTERSINIGSWIMADGQAATLGLEVLGCAVLLMNEYQLPICRFNVRKSNRSVFKVNQRLGAKIIGEDDDSYWLENSDPERFVANMHHYYKTPLPLIERIIYPA